MLPAVIRGRTEGVGTVEVTHRYPVSPRRGEKHLPAVTRGRAEGVNTSCSPVTRRRPEGVGELPNTVIRGRPRGRGPRGHRRYPGRRRRGVGLATSLFEVAPRGRVIRYPSVTRRRPERVQHSGVHHRYPESHPDGDAPKGR